MDQIETKILNCDAVKEAEKNMVFAARLTQRGHTITTWTTCSAYITKRSSRIP